MMYLDEEKIDLDGVKHLFQGKLSSLQSLNLSLIFLIQETTIWGRKAASISQNLKATTYRGYNFVHVDKIKENNQIGFKGCKFIAQAKWPLLKNLTLSINGIK